MSWITVEAGTKEEAQKKALEELGVNDPELIEVEEQKVVRKFLGVGGRTVKLKARLKEAAPLEAADEPEDLTKPPKPTNYDEDVADVDVVDLSKPAEGDVKPPTPIPDDVVTFESRYRPWVQEGPEGVAIPKKGRGFGRRLYDSDPLQPDDEELAPQEPEEEIHEEEAGPRERTVEYEPPTYEDDPETTIPESARDQAIAFVKQVITDMGIDGEVTGFCLADRLLVQIDSDASGLLIGRRGDTIDALQFLTDIVVNRKLEPRIRIVLDTENYRDRRRKRLIEIAHESADEAVKTRREVPLSPMNPADRRVIHTTLADDKDVETFSDGAGSRRRVIIRPKQMGRRDEQRGHGSGKGRGGGKSNGGRGGYGGGGRGGQGGGRGHGGRGHGGRPRR